MAASFFICLALVLLVGLSSARQARAGAADYFLASRSVPPWLVGLSAVATNNSGYMFIGLIGYTHAVGLQSVWLMVGWITGDLLASKIAHERMRDEGERVHANGIISLLARWGGSNHRSWQVVAAVVSVLFLSTYAAAQISAGGKALEGMLDIPMAVGMSMVALVVIAYSIAGGMRASIWTDAAQSLLMVVSMLVLLWATVEHLGGPDAVLQQASAIPGFLDASPTADSLVLSCSSALTQDLPKKPLEQRWMLKAATALVTVFALLIGLWSEQSVFSLVVWAWGTLGAAFVPILIWKVWGAGLNSSSMLCMSLTGVLVTVAWKFHGYPATVYEGAVGMFAALLLGGVLSKNAI